MLKNSSEAFKRHLLRKATNMATDKLFSVAGTSKHPTLGHKIRFANDELRVKNLSKSNHTDILLVSLPNEMTKVEAALFIRGLDEFQGVAEQAAIADFLDRNEGPAARSTKPAKAKAAKPSIEDIRARAASKTNAYTEAMAAVGPAPDMEDQAF
ncbi:hypothetical protein EBT11_09680 [bacterium]|nr:hypothetical protein [Betaproteobacteria bacterium]NBT24886.1 hypothetical protein [bacterium]